jgi:micrococcal nuclease
MELKSCKKCNSDNIYTYYYPDDILKSFLQCKSCGFIIGGLSSKESLIKQWNNIDENKIMFNEDNKEIPNIEFKIDKNLYNYKAKLINMIDGDTLDISIDLGFDISIIQRVRLVGIDTPETRTTNKLEKETGLYIKNVLSDILKNRELYVTTIKSTDKFGRYLADVCFIRPSDNELISVSKMLIYNKFAKSYSGTTQKSAWTDEELNFILKK